MTWLHILLVAVSLPLFPFSMLFNRLLVELPDARWRVALVLLWPVPGVLMLVAGDAPPPWVLWWAVATAALYALRSLAVRDLLPWSGQVATSAWALLWVAGAASDGWAVALRAIGLGAPSILLVWLASYLERTLGASHAAVCGGLRRTLPRLGALLVVAVLAATATPPAPGFFVLVGSAVHALPTDPGTALGVLVVWLLWAWSAARILRALVVGAGCGEPIEDLGPATTAFVGLAVVAFALAGIGLSGALI